MPASINSQHDALVNHSGLAELQRSQVQILGRDRAQLLQGLCTNDIKRLSPGQGCEAFLTNVQGRVIGYVYVFCGPDALILESAAGQAAELVRNLDRYVIREDVRFTDQSDHWPMLLVSGRGAADILRQTLNADVPERPLNHHEYSFAGESISVRRTTFAGPDSFHLSGVAPAMAAIRQSLRAAGAQLCEPEAVEIVRIEAGTPLFGQDITADNLPQEVDRNELAISFTKGCYLGQETVARIDALGHVNRLLRGLRFPGSELPPAGTALVADGKTLATITSVCLSPQLGAALAIAYVRRGHHDPGAAILSAWGEAKVVRLPIR